MVLGFISETFTPPEGHDSILLDLVIQSYDDQKGDGDPDIRGNGDVYYRLFPRLLKLKMDFSHDGGTDGAV